MHNINARRRHEFGLMPHMRSPTTSCQCRFRVKPISPHWLVLELNSSRYLQLRDMHEEEDGHELGDSDRKVGVSNQEEGARALAAARQ